MGMNFLRAVGKEVYEGASPILLRGFGLGGWFLPEGYMWKLYKKCDRPRRMEAMIEALCGKDYAEYFWKSYLDGYITKEDIGLIAGEGFNSVRLPLNARHLYEIHDNEPILNSAMIARIDQLIDWCGRYQVYVILDMHGAPGGQTGQNIDDSEDDKPLLFLEDRYEKELTWLWQQLALRYSDNKTVAGYDLLNEPLPNWFSRYNSQVLPLYRRLINTIRKVDTNHMIILEGVHWATDFSIFDSFTRKEAADNIMLQFHKYWSNPDEESVQNFITCADRLNLPLFMGEGGENNCDWYTTAFVLYEQLKIGWSFWSYKKMDCTNSPITFEVPEGWEELIRWLEGEAELTSERATDIFDSFLKSIRASRINKGVFHALKREIPVRIPCEAYQEYDIQSARVPGAVLRMEDPVSLIIENGRIGEVDYGRQADGEPPEAQNVLVHLFAGDRVSYLFYTGQEKLEVTIRAEGDGELLVSTELGNSGFPVTEHKDYSIALEVIPDRKQLLHLSCSAGNVKADYISLRA